MSQASDMVRKNFKAGDDKRDAGLATPPDVVRFDDIAYGQDEDQVLDVYRPRGAEGQRLAVIVSVHGGGWVYGNKERYQYYCMDLARRGFAVVNFTYRLAPEHKFPASLEDTNSVFAWVLSNGAQYGFDAANIFAVGDSAGAHCLGLYAGLCTNPTFAARFPFTPPAGFAPKAIALNCGAYVIDLTSGTTDDLTKSLMADFLPQGGTRDELEAINVLGCVTEKYPPVFLMTSTGDFLRGQAPLLRDKLDACSVPHVSRFYAAGEADLGHVFHLNVRSEAARLCNDEECSFFERLARQVR